MAAAALRAGLALVLLMAPPLRAGPPPESASEELSAGAFDEFDNAVELPPTPEGAQRLALGDIHGFAHVYERRARGYQEVWVSEYFEGPIAGLLVADTNADSLAEIVLYTDGGRLHFLDLTDYRTLWSNPRNDYQSISAMAIHNVDDDPQLELLFVADGRLVIWDGRDHFAEWRSDQDNIAAADIVVGDVDGDGAEEIVTNDGFVFDARYHDLEWQSPESFGERLGLLDVDDDSIPEVIGEFRGRFLRVFDIDLRRMKSPRR